jgi:DNA-binding transcriptional ArsR family regulator
MAEPTDEQTGDELLGALAAMASPHRLRMLAALAQERMHVSGLAREMELSRPLAHMHLKRLEGAGLVSSTLELSEEGKAMRVYEIEPFALRLTPESVMEAARTLSDERKEKT